MKNALYLVLLASTGMACGSSGQSSNPPGGPGGTQVGGSSSQGAQSSGGAAASGAQGMGAGAGFVTGGTTSSGGGTSVTDGTGATPGGGTSAGGMSPAGGTTAGGGVSGSGGSQPAGGTSGGGTGGSAATGGGVATGGTAETGGATQAGGSVGEGGTAETGGSVGEGGTAETGGSGTAGETECGAPTTTPGTPITFNDNGGWCWYQDERAIVDAEDNKLVIGSVASTGSRDGDVEAVVYDLAGGGNPQRSTLGTNLSVDDHNTAGIVKVSTGKYVAVYTGHNENCNSYYNVYDNGSWGQQQAFDWITVACPVSTPSGDRTISYSNLWQMPGKIFNFVRSVETSPNLIVSTDGSSWTYAGRLTSTETVGYVAGYYKYWGNNVDRIDFVATENHPRDFDNSLYHGYVKATSSTVESFDSFDQKKGTIDEASRNDSPEIGAFTKIFATGTTINGVTLTNMWNHDIMRYDDGTIVVLGQGRVSGSGTDNPDKRFIYLRFDGSQWSATYLVKGGDKLYDAEQDYTGLGAIHPNDPHTIYISTNFDPRTDTSAGSKREIWRGTTCDEGKTFDWTPITENSSVDNVRPIVPSWPGGKTVLLWMKGTYRKAQDYTMSIVGLILDGP